jgi:hypothetical protein
MKINPYYIAGAVAVLVILIVVFTQRSDWDAANFILRTDSEGNLTPISESYFEGEEQRMAGVVNATVSDLQGRKFAYHDAVEPGRVSCAPGGSNHPNYANACVMAGNAAHGCLGQIQCPAGTVAIRERRTCYCTSLSM